MKDKLRFFDKIAFFILIIICLIGIILVYSASHNLDVNYYLKQVLRVIFSIICLFIIFQIETEKIFKKSFLVYLILVMILFLQVVTGKIISGTKSWIKIGFLFIQVSEFVKIFVAICLAKYLVKIKRIEWKSFFVILLYVGIPFFLIALQPDLGTAFMLISFVIVSIMLKGIRPLIVVVSLIFIIGITFIAAKYILKPYQKARLISFINPHKYEKSSGYQVIQSKIAIGSGGISGKGFLKGSQTRYKFLPTRHTDFILSVMGEEFGFLGVSLLLFLFFIFFYRQLDSDIPLKDEFYFTFLFTGIIIFQFFINVAMTIGFFPVLGIPLPFVSYGGSSILAFFIGEGIIFRIRINRFLT